MIKINRNKARKLFLQNKEIVLVPNKCKPETTNFKRILKNEYDNDEEYFNYAVEDFKSMFCNYENGYEVSYYYKENKFNQLCVWRGTLLGDKTPKDFEELFKLKKYRVKFAEEVTTNPDKDDCGNDIPGTGGRTDILFYIHDDDIQRFALFRFQLGISWWEDVVKYNKKSYLYSEEILKKYPVKW